MLVRSSLKFVANLFGLLVVSTFFFLGFLSCFGFLCYKSSDVKVTSFLLITKKRPLFSKGRRGWNTFQLLSGLFEQFRVVLILYFIVTDS
jgi:hypothetical protein